MESQTPSGAVPAAGKEKAMSQRIIWICNGQKADCKKTARAYTGAGECDHTTDERYAKDGDHHFIDIDGILWEGGET